MTFDTVIAGIYIDPEKGFASSEAVDTGLGTLEQGSTVESKRIP